MEGQLTLTNESLERREKACKSRAQISLPVPVSPWRRTGTSVVATRSSFWRIACMVGVRPKTMSRGGRSRKAAEFTKWSKGCPTSELDLAKPSLEVARERPYVLNRQLARNFRVYECMYLCLHLERVEIPFVYRMINATNVELIFSF